MRVTNANAFDRSLQTLQARQEALQEAQAKLTSGKRIARASDDPTAAARAERALAQAARTDAHQRALEASRSLMTLAEAALGEAGEVLQDARELLVQAGNPTLADGQRASLAGALRSLRKQMLEVSNRGDGAGGWLFGGQGAATPPFVDAPGGVQFRGMRGELNTDAEELLPISVDGEAAFLRAASGNGVFVVTPAAGNGGGAWADSGRVVDPAALTGDDYSVVFSVGAGGTTYAVLRNGAPTAVTAAPYVSGQTIEFDGQALTVSGTPADGDRVDTTPSAHDLSVFDVLARAAEELETPGRSGAQVTQTAQRALRDVDQSLSTLIATRAAVGETLNRTDALENRLADAKLAAQSERSSAEDLDMVQAVSDFQTRQTSYDAALKAYSMVQRLSLFQYIG
jgi:flagellar hook-associated protein 3 FlgL